MSDLLKEAIADAKAVRETALQNAKMALEEAFTPQLKNMLSAKLKEDEMGDDEEEEMSMEDEMGDEEEEGIPAEEGTYEDEEMDDEETMEIADEDEFGGEEEPEVEEDEVASAMEDEMGDEEDEGEEKLDLEAIIRR